MGYQLGDGVNKVLRQSRPTDIISLCPTSKSERNACAAALRRGALSEVGSCRSKSPNVRHGTAAPPANGVGDSAMGSGLIHTDGRTIARRMTARRP